MLGPDQSTAEMVAMGGLFGQTRDAFRSYWERGGYLSADDAQFLATATLSHIDDMDIGLKWVTRTSEVPRDELRCLLTLADSLDWEQEPDAADPTPIAPDLRRVMALRHAQVVFGCLPRTPTGEISYPGYASYADISVPRTPLELRERIAELARGVWNAASRRAVDTLDPGPARRVYGFFEAGSWVAATEVRRIRRRR